MHGLNHTREILCTSDEEVGFILEIRHLTGGRDDEAALRKTPWDEVDRQLIDLETQGGE